jgi:inner membrane protein
MSNTTSSPSWAAALLAGFIETAKQIGRKLRWVALGFLLLVMQWPLSQVDSLVRERQARRDEARAEVGAHFGMPQLLTGPVLTVPYRIWKTEEWETNGKKNRKVTWHRGYAHFLPAELRVKAAVEPEIRRRGLFEVPVYTAALDLAGRFDPPSFEAWSVAPDDILWGEAWMSVEVTDRKAITAPIALTLGQETLRFEVGAPEGAPLPRSLQSRVSGARAGGGDFTGQVRLRGSERLSVAPMGGRTTLAMTSPWPHPSFDGAYLPEHRTVGASGFEADWSVLRFGRDFGQQWNTGTLEARVIDASAFGATFKNPTDLYSEVARSTRYSLLFLVMTFLILYLWEVLRRAPIHPLQYLLCGCALALFYVLELALSEHFGFLGAYAAAAGAIVAAITLYARAIFASGRGAGALGGMLAVLYAFLFVTLQAEDHALMIGALGLLALLAAVMYATRRLNRRAEDSGSTAAAAGSTLPVG